MRPVPLGPVSGGLLALTLLLLPTPASASAPGAESASDALAVTYVAGGATLVLLQVADFAALNDFRFPGALAAIEAIVYGFPLSVAGAVSLAEDHSTSGGIMLAAGLWATTHAIYVVARPEPRRTRLTAMLAPREAMLQLTHAF
jgi:hypothetical protein